MCIVDVHVGLRKGLPLTRLAVMGAQWSGRLAPVAASCQGRLSRPSPTTAPLLVVPVDVIHHMLNIAGSTACIEFSTVANLKIR